VRQSPLVDGSLLRVAAGRILAEQLVDCRLRVADQAKRVAERLGSSGVRSGKLSCHAAPPASLHLEDVI
jgi:hypothetical protein